LSVEDADKDVDDDTPAPSGAQKCARPTGVPALQVVYRANQEIARNGAESMLDMMAGGAQRKLHGDADTRFPSTPGTGQH